MIHTVYVDPPAGLFFQELQESVPSWHEEQTRQVILDFSAIEDLDSVETGFLVQLLLRASRFDILLHAANVSPPVQHALSLSGIGGLMGIPEMTPPRFDSTFSD